jgi:hypothetical protein
MVAAGHAGPAAHCTAAAAAACRLLLQVPSVLEGVPGAAPKLFVSNLEEEPLRGKALSFSSVAGSRGVSEKSVDTDVVVAEVAPQVLASLQAMLTELYIPLVASQQGGRPQAEAAKEDFIQVGAAREAAAGATYPAVRSSARCMMPVTLLLLLDPNRAYNTALCPYLHSLLPAGRHKVCLGPGRGRRCRRQRRRGAGAARASIHGGREQPPRRRRRPQVAHTGGWRPAAVGALCCSDERLVQHSGGGAEGR